MTQYATLDGTSDAGGWTRPDMGSPIHTWADTTTAGADYIQATTYGGSVGPAIFTLSNVDDPETASDHKIKYKAQGVVGGMSYGSGPALTIALYEGTTERHSTTNSSLSTSSGGTDYTITLSESEANSITDYDNLLIRLTMGGDMEESVYIYVAYFECPDAEEEEEAVTSPAFLLFMG